jgi:hypothetical protein
MSGDDSRREHDGTPPEEWGLCAECGGRTRPVRYTPKLSGLPELVTFECADCGNIETAPRP